MRQTIPAGQYLWHEGKPCKKMFVVLKGVTLLKKEAHMSGRAPESLPWAPVKQLAVALRRYLSTALQGARAILSRHGKEPAAAAAEAGTSGTQKPSPPGPRPPAPPQEEEEPAAPPVRSGTSSSGSPRRRASGRSGSGSPSPKPASPPSPPERVLLLALGGGAERRDPTGGTEEAKLGGEVVWERGGLEGLGKLATLMEGRKSIFNNNLFQ